uniref:Indole-3-glycerol phosphate synthase n=1 Tax=Calcidiscus leptoporus TaxID=127549 RepID=A0A7S0J3B2_9EUKA|mmetsp:Transcript_37144/g.86815  ORF Transcript_37144/g.86815 Transcript_37144/m.86815 type:complete len:512 (+) Transcript_37144:17-1552(+)|eukprot:CAMPEP_0119356462 /NCGR_PEP_ID=MMETSP1334-20130426/5060_1 /TAXON_ID=127549 /ORGANISM="Calcidiscus leptoporus, Strain RCC1130" /LENGTH=511 /DNA_ID=CAMNT_0007370495 /DNA_START=16 /DNA_END=1551 /DNA_ORIENTATION=+
MPSILNTICEQRRLDVAAAKQIKGEPALQAEVERLTSAPNDFAAALRANAPMALVAEIKRASPSKGEIAAGVHAPSQALAYALGGACAISVLTEPTWFKGSLEDLRQVRQSLDGAGLGDVCVLRKDFIIDQYQLLEARACGADTALLIVALLPLEVLVALIAFSRGLGMEPLVEAANEEEMKVAIQAGSKVIGINNRNLHTFEVDMGTTGRLTSLIPTDSGILVVALSGVSCRRDVCDFAAVGAKGVLVGESLMRAPSVEVFISQLLDVPPQPPLCKICGLRDTEAAAAAAAAGADFIGIIFAKSKRQVSIEEGRAIVQAVRAQRRRPPEWKLPEFEPSETELRPWLLTWRALLTAAARRAGPLAVGVFVDATVEEMNATAEAVGLDLIQLHGAEGWEIVSQLDRPAIRVVHMEPDVSADDVSSSLTGGKAVAVLLDSKGGGTGKTFDWQVGSEVQARAPFILAGGLTPENVAAAVGSVRPWCVDVSSGVESGGVKDLEKIRSFVSAAHGY